jgi:hypothetical protein
MRRTRLSRGSDGLEHVNGLVPERFGQMMKVHTAGVIVTLGSGLVSSHCSSLPGSSSFALGQSKVRL